MSDPVERWKRIMRPKPSGPSRRKVYVDPMDFFIYLAFFFALFLAFLALYSTP